MNSDLTPEFIERYQIMLSKDPKSKVFAPLAEAYRKMGWLEQAEGLCRNGLNQHPNFPSGRVVLAKILIDKKQIEEAVTELKAASELSPENILAHRLLAQVLMELRRPKEALRAFKMILFLNPQDAQASKTVARLESLTADEYDDELFQMKPLDPVIKLKEQIQISPQSTPLHPTNPVTQLQRTLDRAISLAEAFAARNDFDKALQTLEDAENQIGQHPELIKRRTFLLSRNSPVQIEEASSIRPVVQSRKKLVEQQIAQLQAMLQRINDRRVE